MSEDPVSDTSKPTTRPKKYLVFMLNEAQYAVPLADVREVIGLPNCVQVPGSPGHSLGLINLRGRVITAIDLKKKIGVHPGVSQIKRPAVIITDCSSTTVGCVVDSILEVLTISDDQIEKGIDIVRSDSRDFIQGVARFPNREMILILALVNAVDGVENTENNLKERTA